MGVPRTASSQTCGVEAGAILEVEHLTLLDPAKEPGGRAIRLVPILIVVKPHAALQILFKGLELIIVGMDTRLERSRLAILNDIVGTRAKRLHLIRGELGVGREEYTDVVVLE